MAVFLPQDRTAVVIVEAPALGLAEPGNDAAQPADALLDAERRLLSAHTRIGGRCDRETMNGCMRAPWPATRGPHPGMAEAPTGPISEPAIGAPVTFD